MALIQAMLNIYTNHKMVSPTYLKQKKTIGTKYTLQKNTGTMKRVKDMVMVFHVGNISVISWQ